MQVICSYIYSLKRHLLRICQFVNLLLKTLIVDASKQTEPEQWQDRNFRLAIAHVIASETVDCSTTVKNIVVIFNDSLSMRFSACYSCMQVFLLSSSKYFRDSQVSFL